MLVAADIDDPGIPSTREDALLLVETDGQGGAIVERLLLREGLALPATGELVRQVGSLRRSIALDGNGRWMAQVKVDAPLTVDSLLVLDGVVVAREGGLSPVPGRRYSDFGPAGSTSTTSASTSSPPRSTATGPRTRSSSSTAPRSSRRGTPSLRSPRT